jgi:hypothetical protein
MKAEDYKYDKLYNRRGIMLYKVVINDCPIAVGVGGVVGCAASLVT